MFTEIEFERMKKLPNYVFAEINELKLKARRNGEDVIDFSMGNPDGATPKHIIDKLVEAAQKPKNHGYSASKGIFKLREAISLWYKRRYNADIDPDFEAVATIGSKEGYVNLMKAIVSVGDTVIVPDPTYPIHSYAVVMAGGSAHKFELKFNEKFEVDEDDFFEKTKKALKEANPKPKYMVVNFPHNPSTATVTPKFYERLVELARQERFYVISDIAYADLTFDGYTTPSIMSVEGAKDVAVETFTLSKSYNMAGWRVGFVVGNRRIITSLQKIKSWLDYGMFTPIQIAATVALNGDQQCVEDIKATYKKRRDILIDTFDKAGWKMDIPNASMFIWARIPEQFRHLGSLEFSKQLLVEAKIAVSPGIGFGSYGDEYVRIALIENEKRIKQAAKNVKSFFKNLEKK
ncbi:MAG: LL-diaminopimelate aminotransferase [Campylobacterales bacterium]|nr:LL-diaminopimelate aminotransferase [Campylobacterales bacterium]